jgi:hypothetical protein
MAGAPSTWQQRATLAWLSAPPGTVLSHQTAAALHGLARPPSVPHLTVPHGRSGRIKGAVVHWARMPAGTADRRWIDGLLCTDVARTITDCASVMTYADLCDLLDEAICRRKTRPAAVQASAARSVRAKGKKGHRQLREALAIWIPGPVADMATEMRLARRLQQWGCPPLERQVKIRDARGKVIARGDLGISILRWLFEYDGEKAHGPRHWAKDDARDAAVEALGGKVFRFTRHDLLPSSTRLRDEVLALLPMLQAS